MTVFSPTNSGSPYPPQRPSTNDLLPQVFGRYLLLRRLSSGGMGEIFLAKYGLAGFQKLCVIKKILPQLNDDEHFISRFVDEAQVTIQLQHSNIAQSTRSAGSTTSTSCRSSSSRAATCDARSRA